MREVLRQNNDRYKIQSQHLRSHFRDSDVQPGSRFLISTRDPVRRLISAFYFVFASGKHSGSLGRFYDCFQNVSAFAEALEDSGECGTEAQNALGDGTRDGCDRLGHDKDHQRNHVCKGFQYHLSLIMSALEDPTRNSSVYLTRQESLQHDCDGLRTWLGDDHFDARLPDEHEASSADRCSKTGLQCSTEISEVGMHRLRNALQPEYDILERLERVADNGVFRPGLASRE